MKKQIPSTYNFNYGRQYVKLQPDEVKKILAIQGSPRKTGVSKTA